MPLFKPKSSKKSDPKDMEESSSGKSLPIAMNIQKMTKKKKMSDGGMALTGPNARNAAQVKEAQAKGERREKFVGPGALSEAERNAMADGGEVQSIASKIRAKRSKSLDFTGPDEGLDTTIYDHRKADEDAMKKENYADGGMIEDNEEAGEMEDHEDSLNSLNKLAHEQGESMDEEESEHSGSPMDALDESMVSAIRRKLSSKRGD